jgi:GH24 family phage-related lysozyme (muramidase)
MSKQEQSAAPKRVRKTLEQKLAEARDNTDWLGAAIESEQLTAAIKQRDARMALIKAQRVAETLEGLIARRVAERRTEGSADE